jgi:predicted dehydrogenase
LALIKFYLGDEMMKISVGLIGTGGISHWHIKQLKELDEVAIVAAADPSKQSREQAISENKLENVKQFDDYKDMLNSVKLDAVVICSPHTLHHLHIKDALENGCHVLVEKPMACTIEETEELIQVADKSGKVLQVSYQRHFDPLFIYIKEAIESGEIGKLTSVTASLYQNWKPLTIGTWRQNPQLSGGGMLLDSGSHIIDILLWTTGLEPEQVVTTIDKQGTPVEIDSFTSIRFTNGVIAGLNIVGNAPCWHETYVFAGEEGAIFFENGKIVVRRNNGDEMVPELPKQTTNQDKSFIDAILGKHEVMVPGHFAQKVIQLTNMIYKAGNYNPS